eukprot:363500-Chlamydomonas_euryale.AAC.18
MHAAGQTCLEAASYSLKQQCVFTRCLMLPSGADEEEAAMRYMAESHRFFSSCCMRAPLHACYCNSARAHGAQHTCMMHTWCMSAHEEQRMAHAGLDIQKALHEQTANICCYKLHHPKQNIMSRDKGQR